MTIWSQLHPWEQNALVAQTLFGYQISWRTCAADPETGMWEEVQSYDPNRSLSDGRDGIAVQALPCYNFLDTQLPYGRGWTPELVAERCEDFYNDYWHVVEGYAQQERTCRCLLMPQILQLGLVERYQNELICVLGLEEEMQVYNSAIEVDEYSHRELPGNVVQDGHIYLWLFSQATPEECCHAAIRAFGVEV